MSPPRRGAWVVRWTMSDCRDQLESRVLDVSRTRYSNSSQVPRRPRGVPCPCTLCCNRSTCIPRCLLRSDVILPESRSPCEPVSRNGKEAAGRRSLAGIFKANNSRIRRSHTTSLHRSTTTSRILVNTVSKLVNRTERICNHFMASFHRFQCLLRGPKP